MVSRRLIPLRRSGGVPGLLLAVLALVSQIALGMIVLSDKALAREQSVAALDALSVVCDSSAPAPAQAPRRHQHAPDCALCPLTMALALPAAVLTSAPEVPAPSSQAVARAFLPPPARGPPAQPRPTPPSRGPPVLS